MKLFAIAVVLALLALTRAEDEPNQVEQFDSDSRPLQTFGEIKPPRLGQPSKLPLVYRLPLRQPSEEQQVENENSIIYSNQDHPPRHTVAFDIKFDFGQGNQIYED